VWSAHTKINDDDDDPEETARNRDISYDLPYIMPFIRKFEFFKWVPISPTFLTHWIPDIPTTLPRRSRNRVSVVIKDSTTPQPRSNANNGTKLQIYNAN